MQFKTHYPKLVTTVPKQSKQCKTSWEQGCVYLFNLMNRLATGKNNMINTQFTKWINKQCQIKLLLVLKNVESLKYFKLNSDDKFYSLNNI